MLAKIISALALTLLLTGGALAYIPQPDNKCGSKRVRGEHRAIRAATTQHHLYGSQRTAGAKLRTELFQANAVVLKQQPHKTYAVHSNSVQAQVGLEIQLFAANPVLSEPRQFD